VATSCRFVLFCLYNQALSAFKQEWLKCKFVTVLPFIIQNQDEADTPCPSLKKLYCENQVINL
jgi:hypothetical protein